MKFDFIKVSDKKLRSIVAGGMELGLRGVLDRVTNHSLVVAYDNDGFSTGRIGFAVGMAYGYNVSELKTNENKVYVLDPVDGSVVYYDHIVSPSIGDCPEVIVNRGYGCTDYEIAKVVGLSDDLKKFRIIVKHSGENPEIPFSGENTEIPFDKVQFIDNVKMTVEQKEEQ